LEPLLLGVVVRCHSICALVGLIIAIVCRNRVFPERPRPMLPNTRLHDSRLWIPPQVQG
jgi:hypothetical protein